MFVIIQCMDNLDDTLDPKEKVAQVSPSQNKCYAHEETFSTGNEARRRGHHGDFLHGCCSIFHRCIHGMISKLLLRKLIPNC